jgi:hypothetical protein
LAVGLIANEISIGRALVTAGDEDHYFLASWRAAVVGVMGALSAAFGAIHP